MDDQEVKLCKCGRPITPAEKIAYGGDRCESCWADSPNLPRTPKKKRPVFAANTDWKKRK